MIDSIRLRISLNDSAPLIWRELAVSPDISFAELHHAIQLSMPWKNTEQFMFITEGYRIGLLLKGDSNIENSVSLRFRGKLGAYD